MSSVNFNAAANSALRTLQSTNTALNSTQSRISTGLAIGEAKDNAAYWSISTTLKSDNKSLSTVKDALGLGAATVDTAYQGLNAAKDVLDEIKSKLTAATQDGVDRTKIQAEISELQKQLKSIAQSSTFSGENWLSVDSSAGGYVAGKTVVSGFTKAADGTVTLGTIGVDTSNLSLFNGNVSATNRGILDNATALTKSDGTALDFGGQFLGNQSVGGLVAANQGVISAVTVSASATWSDTVTFDNAGDSFTFTIALDGGSAQTVTVNNTMASSINSGVIDSGARWAQLLQSALDTQGIAVSVGYDATTTKLTYTSSTKGPNADIVVTAGVATNGGGSNTMVDGNLNEIATSASATTADRVFTKAKAILGEFTAPITLDADDTIQFQLTRDGDATTTRIVTVTKAIADAASTRSDGKILNASEFAAAITGALASAKTVGGATSGVAANYSVSAVGNKVAIQTATSGSTQKTSNVSVAAIKATANTAGTSDKLSIADIDISDATLLSRGAVNANGRLDAAKVKDVLAAYITSVNKAIDKVTSAAANLGAVSSRIDLQKTFVTTLMDTIDKGVSNLVDADMNEESTKLQALQVKQQLGVQALSIANQSAQSVLSLFRG